MVANYHERLAPPTSSQEVVADDGIVHTVGNYRSIWSSACTLRRSVKSGNMRNPYSVFYVSQRTAWDNQEEGGDDAKSAWPFDILGGTHVTME